MSRYEFEQPGVRLAIGWDAPMATFFLQVWSEMLQTVDLDEDARDLAQIWLGDVYAEHPEPDSVLSLAREHIPGLPTDLGLTLRIDQLAAPAKPLPADHEEIARLITLLLNSRFS